MNKKQRLCWGIDAAMGAGFLLTYFMDTTGLILHQWLGVLVGAGVVMHLLLHQKWLKTTARNFASKATNRSRWYLILDSLLGLGFLGIIFTGLVISTWANLYLANYPLWLAVHITVSIETLVLLAVKLATHWQWIVATSRKVFQTGLKTPLSPVPVTAASAIKVVDRRDFLKLAGIVGAATAVALVKAADGLSQVSSADDGTLNSDVLAVEIPESEETQAAPVIEATEAVQPTQQVPDEAVQATSVESTAMPAPTATQVVQQQASCVVRCPRGCSYPGRCHKYTDSNSNKKCDLGECL